MGHISIDQQSRLLAHLYSGTIEYGQWTDFLRVLATTFDGVNASLATIDTATGKPVIHYTSRAFDRRWYDHYADHYARVSPLRRAMFRAENIGRVMTCEQIMAPQDFENSEFYRDYLAKYGIRYVLGSVFKIDENTASYVAVHRAADAGAFDAGQVDAAQGLLPHLQLAYRIRKQFIGVGRYEDVSQQYMDAKNKGLICIDWQGRIVSMNREAERIMALDDGLAHAQDRFLTLKREDEVRLRNLLKDCCQSTDGNPAAPQFASTGGTIVLPRSGGKPSYSLWVFPIHARSTQFDRNQIAAAIEITDPLNSPQKSAQALLAGYGLTPAELRLAEALIRGSQLKDIAIRRNVSINTLKVQRRSLYRKIGATRHFDLLALARHDA